MEPSRTGFYYAGHNERTLNPSVQSNQPGQQTSGSNNTHPNIKENIHEDDVFGPSRGPVQAASSFAVRFPEDAPNPFHPRQLYSQVPQYNHQGFSSYPYDPFREYRYWLGGEIQQRLPYHYESNRQSSMAAHIPREALTPQHQRLVPKQPRPQVPARAPNQNTASYVPLLEYGSMYNGSMYDAPLGSRQKSSICTICM